MMKIFVASLCLLLLALPSANARYSNACFTKDEVRRMLQKRDVVSKGASDCLKSYWSSHEEFFQANHYSKYFGVRNKSLDTVDKRARALLFVLAPKLVPSDVQKAFEQFWYETAPLDEDGNKVRPGLSDLEKYLQRVNPALYQVVEQQKDALQLVQRAQEERGKQRGSACASIHVLLRKLRVEYGFTD